MDTNYRARFTQRPDLHTVRVKVVSEMQTKSLEVPQHKRRPLEVLAEVVKPFAANMKTLPPPLAANFDDTVSWTPTSALVLLFLSFQRCYTF